MRRLERIIKSKQGKCLSIFLTAGYPQRDSALMLVPELDSAGVDFIELGIPFSDPMADGEVIQEASAIALKNGMNLKLLFEQIGVIRETSKIPIVLMGYFNPILQFGVANFTAECRRCNIDAVLIPDLPIEIYQREYKAIFQKSDIPIIFMITPDSSDITLQKMEDEDSPFTYLVAKSNITGGKNGFSSSTVSRLEEFSTNQLKTPVMVGFGIHDKSSFEQITKHYQGGIIGSEFIRQLKKMKDIKPFIQEFG